MRRPASVVLPDERPAPVQPFLPDFKKIRLVLDADSLRGETKGCEAIKHTSDNTSESSVHQYEDEEADAPNGSPRRCFHGVSSRAIVIQFEEK